MGVDAVLAFTITSMPNPGSVFYCRCASEMVAVVAASAAVSPAALVGASHEKQFCH
jgi:hypothetical protein